MLENKGDSVINILAVLSQKFEKLNDDLSSFGNPYEKRLIQ